MADVRSTLQAVPSPEVRTWGSALIMTAKQDLLSLLLENESMRLAVWLHPLDHERRHIFVSGTLGNPTEVGNNKSLMFSDLTSVAGTLSCCDSGCMGRESESCRAAYGPISVVSLDKRRAKAATSTP